MSGVGKRMKKRPSSMTILSDFTLKILFESGIPEVVFFLTVYMDLRGS